jgi:putative phosphoesterase
MVGGLADALVLSVPHIRPSFTPLVRGWGPAAQQMRLRLGRILSVVRVVALSDVHGNLPALEAALVDVEREDPDLMVICGDVASGPLPSETIDLLMRIPEALFVRGNADRGLVAAYDGLSSPEWAGPYAEWCAKRISRGQRDFLASFEETVRLDVDGLGRVLFCHGSPRSDEEMITAWTPPERLHTLVASAEADVVVCGHTHMAFDRSLDGVRIVNPGSVGMPYGAPGAHWALLGLRVELHCSDYDRFGAASRIRSMTGTEMEEFVRENVLAVPSADEAFAFFAQHGGP